MSGDPSLLEILRTVERIRERVDERISFRIEVGGDLIRMEMMIRDGSVSFGQQAIVHRREIEDSRSPLLIRIEAMGEAIRRHLVDT